MCTKNNTVIYVARASNSKRDCDAWTLLLLAATVRSFAHVPLWISDRNSTNSVSFRHSRCSLNDLRFVLNIFPNAMTKNLTLIIFIHLPRNLCLDLSARVVVKQLDYAPDRFQLVWIIARRSPHFGEAKKRRKGRRRSSALSYNGEVFTSLSWTPIVT